MDCPLPAGSKYGNMLPSVYDRLLNEELPRHKARRDAEKAARRALHGIAEAYFPIKRYKRALALLESGDTTPGALLGLHASTLERRDVFGAFAAAMRALWPDAQTVLDIACGLNPIALGAAGYIVIGMDIHMGCVEVVNRCALRFGLPIQAHAADILDAPLWPPADIALLLKLLPLLERQRPGASSALLAGVPSRRMVVSFPSKTMSGQGVGMSGHYRAMLDGMLPDDILIKDILDTKTETLYFLERSLSIAEGDGGR